MITISDHLSLPAVATLAVAIDLLLGETPVFHPLVGFGNIAGWVDKLCFRTNSTKNIFTERLTGAFAVFIVLVPPLLFIFFLSDLFPTATGIITLYFCIGGKSLFQHAASIQKALEHDSLENSRKAVSMIVSRNTGAMKEIDIVRAAIESVLENGSDAIFGTLFWFLILGAPGALLFRLSNTLDAMWGYKNERYLHFGWFAARLDDILCFFPARLTALAYAFAGNTRMALSCWREQAPLWYSPNAGPVMSSGAGALEVSLGGPAYYHGRLKNRPALGCGREPVPGDIGRAVKLVQKSLIFWLALVVVWGIANFISRLG